MKEAVTRLRCAIVLTWVAIAVGGSAFAEDHVLTLSDSAVRLTWKKSTAGWLIQDMEASAVGSNAALPLGRPSGRYTILFSATEPDPKSQGPALSKFFDVSAEHREGTEEAWARATDSVSLNTAGQALNFLPGQGQTRADGSLEFDHEDDIVAVQAHWSLDPIFPGDVHVTLVLTAKRAGYFSIATPTLITVPVESLRWATVPGYFRGSTIAKNLLLSYAYGQGLPDRPVVLRESTATTLASIMTHESGATLGVVAEPGTAADPWTSDKNTRSIWKLGLSHMNRDSELSPTLYHPVLGQEGSKLSVGEKRTFRFRYVVRAADWFVVNQHVAEDIYRLGESLALREPRMSLTQRLRLLYRYVTDDRTSLWRVEDFGNVLIGGQTYMGAVAEAKETGDSIKNADSGTMWMLARLTGDPKLTLGRLPFVRNFKLSQVQSKKGFFQGAAVGQYYLPSSKRFTEEWGNYVEPVGLTYYSLIDIGNILLFSPEDTQLKELFRLSAERLLSWQYSDGHWEVGYDHKTEQPVFTDLTDYRPTFYGLLVAYKVLGDTRYLAAARHGADWLVDHAVSSGRFLGVCADFRFLPDFSTGQIAQGLLELYAATGDSRYRDAGIAVARFYVTSVYTHPIASNDLRVAGGALRHEWEINQAGLGVEQGGLLGSAVERGPILLASHAGLFLHVFQLTGDPIFRDMARSAAVARDAFVDSSTGVSSYYWKAMNGGAGPYPHHAWWQIGWITDYLLAEIALRSQNTIAFPRGFFAPKVGPHAPFGFAPGMVYGEKAELSWGEVDVGDPAIDYVVARATESSRVFLIVLNEVGRPKDVVVTPEARALTRGKATRWSSVRIIGGDSLALNPDHAIGLTLPGYGLTVIALDFHP